MGDFHPMLVECWAYVGDGSPAFIQDRVTVSCVALLSTYTASSGGVAENNHWVYFGNLSIDDIIMRYLITRECAKSLNKML